MPRYLSLFTGVTLRNQGTCGKKANLTSAKFTIYISIIITRRIKYTSVSRRLFIGVLKSTTPMANIRCQSPSLYLSLSRVQRIPCARGREESKWKFSTESPCELFIRKVIREKKLLHLSSCLAPAFFFCFQILHFCAAGNRISADICTSTLGSREIICMHVHA